MRCMVPVTQEKKCENSIKRASKICDEISLLYIVDTEIIEKMKRESSYVLNSETLASLEKALIESQKKEAQVIEKEAKSYGKPVRIHFEVGNRHEILERYAVKLRADMIMLDDMERAMLSFGIPLWVDGGGEISKIVFYVRSVRKIGTLRRQMEFLREISDRLGAELYIYTEIREDGVLRTLRSMSELTKKLEGDAIAMQGFQRKIARKWKNIMVFGDKIPLLPR